MKTVRRDKSYMASAAALAAVLVLGPVTCRPAAAQSAPSLDDGFGEKVSSRTDRTDIRGAIEDSIRFLMIEHAVRVGTQEKTREALHGPFFGDYRRSVRMPRQWGDTDSWLTNYVGHPGQGAASGYIWLNHSPDGQQPFERSRAYLDARLRATVFAAVYSLQFEIGPFSEASIGNVGMKPETAGWVDYVATPAGGFGIMIAEDLLDRFVVGRLEGRTNSRIARAMLRMFLNPSRAAANVSALRAPWYRAGRPISGFGN